MWPSTTTEPVCRQTWFCATGQNRLPFTMATYGSGQTLKDHNFTSGYAIELVELSFFRSWCEHFKYFITSKHSMSDKRAHWWWRATNVDYHAILGVIKVLWERYSTLLLFHVISNTQICLCNLHLCFCCKRNDFDRNPNLCWHFVFMIFKYFKSSKHKLHMIHFMIAQWIGKLKYKYSFQKSLFSVEFSWLQIIYYKMT